MLTAAILRRHSCTRSPCRGASQAGPAVGKAVATGLAKGGALHAGIAGRSFWNMGRLRSGERLRTRLGPMQKRKWQHSNTWLTAGVLKVAFSAIGSLTRRATGMRVTHRDLDALAAISFAFQDRQAALRRCVTAQLQATAALRERPQWLILQRVWDCTPIKVTYGGLRSSLLPTTAGAKQGSTLGTDQRRAGANREGAKQVAALGTEQPHTGANGDLALGAASMIPHAGVLEMMGQVGFVTWPEAQREGQVVRRERLVFPPVFLSRANASTQHTALERTLEPLNFTNLLGLCKHVRFVVLSLGADLASSNVRLKLEVGALPAAQ